MLNVYRCTIPKDHIYTPNNKEYKNNELEYFSKIELVENPDINNYFKIVSEQEALEFIIKEIEYENDVSVISLGEEISKSTKDKIYESGIIDEFGILRLKDLEIGRLEIKDEQFKNIKEINFNNCKIKTLYINKISGEINEKLNNLSFSKDNQIDEIYIKNSKIKKIDISQIYSNSIKNIYIINKNEISKLEICGNNKINVIELNDNEFSEKVKIENNNSDSKGDIIKIENNKFFDDVRIIENNLKTLDFGKIISKNNFTNSNKFLKKLWIYRNKFDNINIFGGNEFEMIKISNKSNLNCKKTSKIKYYNSNFKDLIIQDIECKSIELYNLYNTKNLILNNITINNILIDNLKNLENFEFKSIKPKNKESSINIINSNLGKASFFNINLDKFKLRLERSILANIIPNNISWNYNITNKLTNKTESLEDLKKNYTQLKIVSTEVKDQITELKFHNLEMRIEEKKLENKHKKDKKIIGVSYYLSLIFIFFIISYKYFMINGNHYFSISIYLNSIVWILILFKLILKLINKIKNESNLNDLIIFKFNKLSNNHGLNWILPIIWILTINFIFTIIFIPGDSIDKLIRNLLELFSVSNYFTSIETIFDKADFSKTTIIIDIFRRVLTIALIYQTVQAFRKYSRKL